MKTTETYIFKKNQKLHLDEIYQIQALGNGNWWTADDPYDEEGDGGESVTITKNIKFTIVVET